MIYWGGSVQQATDCSDTPMALLQHSWQLSLVNTKRVGFPLLILHRGSKLLSCLNAFGMNLGHHKTDQLLFLLGLMAGTIQRVLGTLTHLTLINTIIFPFLSGRH